MATPITGDYESHTKEELLAEIAARNIEGVSSASLKADIIAALVADDGEDSTTEASGGNIPQVEASAVAETGIDEATAPADSEYGSKLYYIGNEPYAVCVREPDHYGNTHSAKNSIHFWQGTEAQFNATFSHEKKG